MHKTDKAMAILIGLLICTSLCRAGTIAETLAAEDKALAARNAPAPVVRLDAPAQLSVRGVYGVNGDLRTDITYNGARVQQLQPGDRVGAACQVQAIVGSCVTLALIPPPSKRRGKSTGPSSDQCPRACWTAPVASSQIQATGLPPGMPVAPPALPQSPLVARALPGAPYPSLLPAAVP